MKSLAGGFAIYDSQTKSLVMAGRLPLLFDSHAAGTQFLDDMTQPFAETTTYLKVVAIEIVDGSQLLGEELDE